MNYFFEILRYLTIVYNTLLGAWYWFWYPPYYHSPHRQYFLSDTDEFDITYQRVPEDAVYVEEWVQNGMKRCVVRYEGEEIPDIWDYNPTLIEPECPWVWVGDKETEIDLTQTFNKFLVVGNTITLDLVLKLIKVTDKTNLIYIDRKTLEERKFPGDGILIEAANDDRSTAVPSS